MGKTIAIGEYVEGKVKAINHIEEASEEGMNDFTETLRLLRRVFTIENSQVNSICLSLVCGGPTRKGYGGAVLTLQVVISFWSI